MTQSSPSDEVPQGQHDFLTFLDFVAGALELTGQNLLHIHNHIEICKEAF